MYDESYPRMFDLLIAVLVQLELFPWCDSDRLNEKNYKSLRILIDLLKTAKDPIVLYMVCYDIGEYVRLYQRGKK